MPNNNYRNVSVPQPIYSALEGIVKDEGSLYVSISDLVKEALREKIIMIRSQTIVPGKKQIGGDEGL